MSARCTISAAGSRLSPQNARPVPSVTLFMRSLAAPGRRRWWSYGLPLLGVPPGAPSVGEQGDHLGPEALELAHRFAVVEPRPLRLEHERRHPDLIAQPREFLGARLRLTEDEVL